MTRHVWAALWLVLACVALPCAEAGAQDPLRRYDARPAMISAQIRLAMELEQRAFELLPTATRSAEDLKVTMDTVHEAYKMIRFAIGGVRRAQGRKFADPTLATQNELMQEARTKLRLCLNELAGVGAGSHNRLGTARMLLAESYRTLQTLESLLL